MLSGQFGKNDFLLSPSALFTRNLELCLILMPWRSTFRIAVGPMLRRRRSYRKKRSSAEAVCIRWPKVPLREASALQTDLKIE
jgi:hypothetical protein